MQMQNQNGEELDTLHPSMHRHQFHIPKQFAAYLCGNSLGLQPIGTRDAVARELQVWADRGVHGHFDHPHNTPWATIDSDTVVRESARIVGALVPEVAIANSLTVNLHLLLLGFYAPTKSRFKILMEAKAFPSDYFALESQVKLHGFDPKTAIIQLSPPPGKTSLSPEDISFAIKTHGSSLALVLFSGVQYYTGQVFRMEDITREAHAVGARVGFDLAHAVGNVQLALHDWNVDFAVWCTYKYLNGGPGGIGGLYCHERFFPAGADDCIKRYFSMHLNGRLAGWWGTQPNTKFEMSLDYKPIAGAECYRLSNPCVLAVAALSASLSIFAQTDMKTLCARSALLTGYLAHLLTEGSRNATPKMRGYYRIITPEAPDRGAQLSIQYQDQADMIRVFELLSKRNIVVDERKPDVIRIAPAPLYNTFAEVELVARTIVGAIEKSRE